MCEGSLEEMLSEALTQPRDNFWLQLIKFINFNEVTTKTQYHAS